MKPSSPMDRLPNELLEAALAPLSSRELGAAVATVNRRFYAVGVRVLHRRLVEAARLPGHELILECYPPSAKVSTPYLACRHLGTRVGDGDGFDDARPGLADLGRLYASFRPVVDGWPGRARVRERRGDSREASCDGDDRVYDDDDYDDGEELATQDIDLDQGEPFSQLCAVTNVVKPSARQGLFLSHVNACEGVVRVWRRWLADRAAVCDDRAATGGDGVLWVDAAKNVGLRFRVAAGDAPEPAALLSGPCSDEEPAVSYTLVYEELLVRSSRLLAAVEAPASRSTKAVLIAQLGGSRGLLVAWSPMNWDFNSKPMAVAQPPLARSPVTVGHGFARGSPSPTWPLPMTASSRSLSFGSLSTQQRTIKCGRGKHADVELIPQPSDDPDDPLNWSRWRKDLNLMALLATVGLVGSMKTALVTTSGAMAIQYNTSYAAIAALTSVPIVVSTVSALASSMAAKLWGKRPMYLVSALFLLAGCIWASMPSDSFAACMGARTLQGFGWGAFDVLVLGSIQDTYFEHERNLPVSLYNVFTIATTWGSPLIGGLVSNSSGSVTQFRVISGLQALSLPLLVLGAPETAFDRSFPPGMVPFPALGMSFSRGSVDEGGSSWSYRLRRRITIDQAKGYVRGVLEQPSYRGLRTLSTALQALRALVAPTTCLLFALSLVPYGALWGFATSVALVATPPPLALGPAGVGALMVGPWVMATAVVGFGLYRGFHQKFTRRVSYAIVAVGSSLVFIALLSFGLGLDNMNHDRHRPRGPDGPFSLPLVFFTPEAARQLSLPLLSFQLGVLAAGLHVVDTTTRPLLVRSASFTSPSIAVAHRSIGDMHAGVVVLRGLAAAVFVAALPPAVALIGGLRAAVIGLAVVQVVVAAAVVAVCWYLDEAVWRADGTVMGLVDLRMLKQSGSFFEHD